MPELKHLYQIVTQPCPNCGGETVITVTKEQFDEMGRHDRRHIQEIFADLNANTRELIISGIHPECWEAMYGPDL